MQLEFYFCTYALMIGISFANVSNKDFLILAKHGSVLFRLFLGSPKFSNEVPHCSSFKGLRAKILNQWLSTFTPFSFLANLRHSHFH